MSKIAWNSLPPRTCRSCKQQFTTNHARACRIHKESYSGETAQRWMNPGETEGGGIVHYFWTCCGKEDVNAIGCCAQKHLTYDDPDDDNSYGRKPGDGIDN